MLCVRETELHSSKHIWRISVGLGLKDSIRYIEQKVPHEEISPDFFGMDLKGMKGQKQRELAHCINTLMAQCLDDSSRICVQQEL